MVRARRSHNYIGLWMLRCQLRERRAFGSQVNGSSALNFDIKSKTRPSSAGVEELEMVMATLTRGSQDPDRKQLLCDFAGQWSKLGSDIL